MTLKIHNTQSKQKETFEPLNPEQVTMYVCGPTVYNYIHIGNARPVVVFDTLFRLLQKSYPSVKYARNITDVDDKINKAAKEQGVDISAISSQFAEAYHEDIAHLNTLPPSVEPRATGHITEMQDMIQRLIDAGHAYESEGNVLFDVPSMPDYGLLSHRQQEDQMSGARVEVESYKRDPSDFVLWKPSSDDLPGWDSPWGYGRPGWHLECSAMIEKHLGDTIDIHGGGQDLVFPHHENEVAQSQCAHGGETFVRYWMHNGYITIDGEKMSKSLGNFFTLREILALYPGEAIRYALLSGHYRSPLNWSEDLVIQAKASMDRFYTALQNCPEHKQVGDYTLDDLPQDFVTAMEDDLNTAEAMAAIHHITGELNKAITANESDAISKLQQQLLACGDLLGLLKQEPDAWFRWTGACDDSCLSDDEIEALLAERLEARKNKDFARADEIRDQLSDANITIKDSAEGTQWQRG